MIKFIKTSWEWDLTNYGLTFVEENDNFTEQTTKSYSFPITIELNEDVASKLGLIHIEGIVQYEKKIYGLLCIDTNFYDSFISIKNVNDDQAEITFFYGKETLPVFDKKLNTLPFKISTAPDGDLRVYAKTLLYSNWPTVTHQFVKVYRDGLSSKGNYKAFENFVNNYKFNDALSTWYYEQNANETIDNVITAVNKNVMAPMTYILEVLRVGFKTEGLEIRGDLVNNEFAKRLLLVPKNFMEQFSSSQYLNYSFTNYTSQTQIGNQTINVYRQIHIPTNVGSFELKIRVNMNSNMAQYFQLKVVQNNVTLYEAFSENSQVAINETLNITIVNTTIFQDIEVEMRLVQQTQVISDFNNFTYQYKEAQLNIFPSVYTIADYMPDMKFREFFNRIKGWFNLDVVYSDNAVYLNFLDNAIEQKIFKDRSHLQDTKPERDLDKNNLFKLEYPNKDYALVNKDGLTFNEANFTEEETTPIEFNVLPLEVRDNFGSVTAIYPEDENDLMVILFDRLTGETENISLNSYNNQTLTALEMYNNFWQKWLKFRANAETVKDSFRMHYTEAINIKEGEYKYNTQRLIVSIRKQRISTDWYDVEMTAETF
ncbi:hypothetical protein [Winogradskyella sp.]|uniref:hypothetical protein n=1 Tax=Winogradskyella sp. TaxID=1883156 RepID=UPI003BAA4C7C